MTINGNLVQEQTTAKAIMAAWRVVGNNDPKLLSTLLAIAGLESDFNATCQARRSSATGAFQFLDDVWTDDCAPFRKEFGISANLDGRLNPYESALVFTRYLQRNAASLGPYAQDPVLLYFSHYFGRTGVQHFIHAFESNPYTPMEDILSPGAMAANPNLRNQNAQQVYDTYQDRMEEKRLEGERLFAGEGDITLASIGGAITGGLAPAQPVKIPEALAKALSMVGQSTNIQCGQFISNLYGRMKVTDIVQHHPELRITDPNQVTNGTMVFFPGRNGGAPGSDPTEHFAQVYVDANGICRVVESTTAGGQGRRIRADRTLDEVAKEHGGQAEFFKLPGQEMVPAPTGVMGGAWSNQTYEAQIPDLAITDVAAQIIATQDFHAKVKDNTVTVDGIAFQLLIDRSLNGTDQSQLNVDKNDPNTLTLRIPANFTADWGTFSAITRMAEHLGKNAGNIQLQIAREMIATKGDSSYYEFLERLPASYGFGKLKLNPIPTQNDLLNGVDNSRMAAAPVSTPHVAQMVASTPDQDKAALLRGATTVGFSDSTGQQPARVASEVDRRGMLAEAYDLLPPAIKDQCSLDGAAGKTLLLPADDQGHALMPSNLRSMPQSLVFKILPGEDPQDIADRIVGRVQNPSQEAQVQPVAPQPVDNTVFNSSNVVKFNSYRPTLN